MTDLSSVLTRIDQIQALLSPPAPTTAPASSASTTGSSFGSVLASVGGAAGAAAASGAAGSYGSAGSYGAGGVYGATALLGGTGTAGPSGSQVVADAQQYLGVPYLWGGTTTAGFDCSGLVQHVYADLGITLPRTSEQQAQVGQAVPSLAAAQPGDLVFFAGSDGTSTSPGHVGIYLGNGQMIDAPYTGTVVREEPVSDAGPVVAIRRIVGAAPMSTAAAAATSATLAGVGSYAPAFASAGATYGVPATLLASVARVESGLNPSAVSTAGAQGLMQLMPSTAASLGVDPWNPTQAINGAAQLLAANYHQFGSWSLAVAAYNAGSGAVQQYGGIPPYPQTQSYVQSVLAGAGMAP